MINNLVLTGRLTRDVELQQTTSGVPFCAFSLAVQRNYKSSTGETITDFIDCIAWKNRAEFISKHFTKGQMIAIVGEVNTRTYEKDGQNRKVVEVVVRDADFCGSKENTGKSDVNAAENAAVGAGFNYTLAEDLPF